MKTPVLTDYQRIDYWTGWLLLPPVLMTLMGLGHALYSYALLTGLWPELPLAQLAHRLSLVVSRDSVLRLAQMVVMGGFIAIFAGCWLFLVLRNQAILRESAPARRVPPLLGLGLQWSAPAPGVRGERWLVPLWWLTLLGMITSASLGLLPLREPITVAEWQQAYYWLMAAHGLCAAFFLLTWRLGRRLEGLQRTYWQYRDATADPARGATAVNAS